MHFSRVWTIFTFVVLSASLAACEGTEPAGTPLGSGVGADAGVGPTAATAPSTAAPAVASDQAASLENDSQIAAVDVELHSRALVMGAVAGARVDRGDLRLYVIRMVTDDGAASRRVAAIVQGDAIPPQDSPLRRQMGGETSRVADGLWAARPADFDRLYIDQQVALDGQALPLLTALLGRTQDAVLQAELHDQVDALQKQLDDARALQALIAAGAGPVIADQTTANANQ